MLVVFSKEMKRAKDKNHSFDFTYYIVICKLYKMDNESSKKKKKSGKNKTPVTQESEILWSNPEEELFDQVGCCINRLLVYWLVYVIYI